MKDGIGNKRNNFARKERLKSKEIITLFNKGRKLRKESYLVIYKKNNLSYKRLAISFKKKSGKAVYRNYERRIVKEVFRCYKGILPNIDIFIIKISNRRLTYKEAKQVIISLFFKISAKFSNCTC